MLGRDLREEDEEGVEKRTSTGLNPPIRSKLLHITDVTSKLLHIITMHNGRDLGEEDTEGVEKRPADLDRLEPPDQVRRQQHVMCSNFH